jgi:hypothetical protein
MAAGHPTHAMRRGVRGAIAFLACLVLATGAACSRTHVSGPPGTPPITPFIDTLQQRTFAFFWERTNPANGLTPDRWPTPSFSSVAAVGFALTAYPIGVERGWVSRADAAQRTLTTLRFFWNAPQGPEASGVTGHKGFFYHFLDMQTGHRFETVELSTIDTALLLAGILFCQQYYGGAGIDEMEIRSLADSIYRRVDWRWASPDPPLVNMGWRPEGGARPNGFLQLDWMGYNEAMLLYVFALGSPTFSIEPAAWTKWTSTYSWGTYYGQAHVGFPPLFGHQYSHIWIDFRGIRDAYMRGRGIDYFENSRRATIAQRLYAIDNPRGFKDYSADIWGLTASDGPKDTTIVIGGRQRQFFTYSARGASYIPDRDDGTIAPTAVGGSIPFAPEITLSALEAMRRRYGDNLFGQYGFLDAFNPTLDVAIPLQHGRIVPGVGWFDGDYLGIDQGPIIAQIENYRNGMVWEYMKKSPYVRTGLLRAGFRGGWLE